MNLHSKPAARGFSLIELMVALTIGLLLSIGLVSVFGAVQSTSRSNSELSLLHDGLRLAMLRLSEDIKRTGSTFCSNTEEAVLTASGSAATVTARDLRVYSKNVVLPDSGGVALSPPVGAGGTPWPTNTAFPVSPRIYMQGYECSPTKCTPAVPTGGTSPIPPVGIAVGQRVRGTDVLTVRYLRNSGWHVSSCAPLGGGGIALTATKTVGDSPITMGPSSQLALLASCQESALLPLTGAAVTPGGSVAFAPSGGNLIGAASLTCPSLSSSDVRVFDFANDFVTVTYFVALRQKPGAAIGVLNPVLVRRENGVDLDLVAGIERLDFLYRVRMLDAVNGTESFSLMSAEQVNANSTAAVCDRVPGAFQAIKADDASGCLWKSVTAVEVHLLGDSIDDDFSIPQASTDYRYSMDSGGALVPGPTNPAAALPTTALPAGHKYRREMSSVVSVRNHTF